MWAPSHYGSDVVLACYVCIKVWKDGFNQPVKIFLGIPKMWDTYIIKKKYVTIFVNLLLATTTVT
jgi:hypothetical protein